MKLLYMKENAGSIICFYKENNYEKKGNEVQERT